MRLHHLGWNDRLEQAFAPHALDQLEPARVLRVDRTQLLVASERGAAPAVVSGRFRNAQVAPAAFPTVGDWVAIAPPAADGPALVHAVLPRTGVFSRRDAGRRLEEQVLAANVDVALLVCGLDGDFNLRRIERYVATAWDSGATPVIVLNKADLCDDVDARIAEVEAVAPGVAVVALSASQGDGLDALAPWLATGRTLALFGSSGVGKSTLANALLGEARQRTQEVREDDDRGRHTTVHRELLPLPGGALLVDGPGLRLVKLWADDDSLEATFADVDALARGCRFGDCRHDGEPGCAVRAAIDAGTLEPSRLRSWLKLQRELEAFAARHDPRLQAERQRRWRIIHKANRARPDKRR